MAQPHEESPFLSVLTANKVNAWQIARILGMSYITSRKYIKDPHKNFTLEQLIILAGICGIHPLHMVSLICGKDECKANHWYGQYKPGENIPSVESNPKK